MNTRSSLKDLASSHWDFEMQLENAQTSYDIFRILKIMVNFYQFQYFSVLNLTSGNCEKLGMFTVVTNWPPDLIHAYDAQGLLTNSPMMEKLKTSAQPVVWELDDINKERPDGERSVVVDLFREFGFERGVCVPVQLANGVRGAVSFSGKRHRLDSYEIAALAFYAVQIFEHLEKTRDALKTGAATLTDREREALHWTASGKTSAEIAIILSISEHTVNRYITQICHKLNAQNRAHAVGIGIRLGLIK